MPCRPDEVLAEDVQHTRPAHADHGGEGVRPQHERGQNEVPQRADARRRQPVQHEAEQDLTEYRQPEGGHGEEQHGEHHAAVVEYAVLFYCGVNAYRMPRADSP